MVVVMSEKMKKYFDTIEADVEKIYEVAKQARLVGIDPSTEVECPPAKDMAGRVEKLVGPEGIADTIRQWKDEGADQDEICFRAMDLVLEEKVRPFTADFTRKDAVDLAIRVALAIKTEGVVSAPLEGIAKVVIRDNALGGEPYLSLYFAGPIRAAGGTVQAFAVLCAEHVRQKMGIAPWVATEEEVGRFVEEVKLYDRILNLQYPSTNEELAFAVRHLTVELNGDPTEDQEVSAHRDLVRIETNFVRGGPCLVLNDGVLLKSKKILRVIDKRKIEGWDWLRKLKKLAHADTKKEEKKEEEENEKDAAKDYGGDTYKGKKIEIEVEEEEVVLDTPVTRRKAMLDEKNPPLAKFVADIIAGRPVFGDPSQTGGHRIRYGRSRNTGLAACGTHPSQMILLEQFMAVGTQIRIERPGKSGSTMPVTSIEPPIILMPNGDVLQLWDVKEAGKISTKRLYHKILFLGDMLFGYGEFVENNHTIVPSGYVEEWWARELEKKTHESPIENYPTPCLNTESVAQFIIEALDVDHPPTGLQALYISSLFSVGIHPRYLDHWGNINGWDLLDIRDSFRTGLTQLFGGLDVTSLTSQSWDDLALKFSKGLVIPNNPKIKQALEKAFVPHRCLGDTLVLDADRALILYELLGFGTTALSFTEADLTQKSRELTALDMFPSLTSLKVPDKCPYYMGSRMGRPEKSKERKMKPPVQVLFPLGHDSKIARSFQNACEEKYIEVEVSHKQCPKCSLVTFLNKCPRCGTHTEFRKVCQRCTKLYPAKTNECPECKGNLSFFANKKIPIKKYFDLAASKFNKTIPNNIKGVKGMSSAFKVPEPIEKGILRAINDVWVYKDGTIRADATDIPLTHFTPKEISVSWEQIRAMGYDLDVYGQPLTSDDQILEIKCQDVLLTHHVGDYFVQVANFVDDELEYLYNLPRFYNAKSRHDLVGHYMAGLAPHTSAAIVGRLIGFTHAESGYAHPFWHSAKRRNCDGDEDGIMLLLECLLNFSMYNLPSKLGGKMDAPLVLSILLDPREVDGEAHNVDYMSQYPLEFYEDALNYAKPGSLKYMDLYNKYLGTEGQFEGCMFTHPTNSINIGPKKSSYTKFETMEEKIDSQMWLAKTIVAVDEKNVARKVIGSHFTPDVLGNLRSFATQGFRCTKCGAKYRRIPLSGRCLECGGDNLLQTVHAGGITKYLDRAISMIDDFELGNYMYQRWTLIKDYIDSLTNNPRVKQMSISSFFK